jgi:hypothetical protein
MIGIMAHWLYKDDVLSDRSRGNCRPWQGLAPFFVDLFNDFLLLGGTGM